MQEECVMRLIFIQMILDDISKEYSVLFIVYCFVVIQFQKYVLTRSLEGFAPLLLAHSEGWGALQAPRALLGAFSPLIHSRRCQTKHAQFSFKIGLNNIIVITNQGLLLQLHNNYYHTYALIGIIPNLLFLMSVIKLHLKQ